MTEYKIIITEHNEKCKNTTEITLQNLCELFCKCYELVDKVQNYCIDYELEDVDTARLLETLLRDKRLEFRDTTFEIVETSCGEIF